MRNGMDELCECGCGNYLPKKKYYSQNFCRITGKKKRFIRGHSLRKYKFSPFKNGRIIDKDGRPRIWMPNHKRASAKGYLMEHIFIAENALGKPLKNKHPVHHFDENKGNNKNHNLVICEDNSYHRLLHMRKRAYDACGDPNWRRCRYCKQYDNPKNMYIYERQMAAQHNSCANKYVIEGKDAF